MDHNLISHDHQVCLIVIEVQILTYLGNLDNLRYKFYWIDK